MMQVTGSGMTHGEIHTEAQPLWLFVGIFCIVMIVILCAAIVGISYMYCTVQSMMQERITRPLRDPVLRRQAQEEDLEMRRQMKMFIYTLPLCLIAVVILGVGASVMLKGPEAHVHDRTSFLIFIFVAGPVLAAVGRWTHNAGLRHRDDELARLGQGAMDAADEIWQNRSMTSAARNAMRSRQNRERAPPVASAAAGLAADTGIAAEAMEHGAGMSEEAASCATGFVPGCCDARAHARATAQESSTRQTSAAPRLNLHYRGPVYYTAASHTIEAASGNTLGGLDFINEAVEAEPRCGFTLAYGMRGEVVDQESRAMLSPETHVDVRFTGCRQAVQCNLKNLSLTTPPTRFAGFELGELVYYTGASGSIALFYCNDDGSISDIKFPFVGRHLVLSRHHGQRGKVVGPPTRLGLNYGSKSDDDSRRAIAEGVAVQFAGNIAPLTCLSNELSRQPAAQEQTAPTSTAPQQHSQYDERLHRARSSNLGGMLVGKKAMISGLSSRPELNGAAGDVTGFVEHTGRYIVRVNGEDISLNPSRLTPLLTGKTVMITGLTSRTELNGRIGVVSDYNAESDRYDVNVDGEKIAVKAARLSVRAATPSDLPPIGKCSSCSASLHPRAKFCEECGKRVV